MAVIGRRRTLQALDFHNRPFPVQCIGQEAAHDAADFHVVGPDEGGVFVRIDFPVEKNDRNAGVEGFFHGRGDGVRLVGRDHQEIHAVGDEAADLLHLPVAVIIGR